VVESEEGLEDVQAANEAVVTALVAAYPNNLRRFIFKSV
jgi:hypothetical protein